LHFDFALSPCLPDSQLSENEIQPAALSQLPNLSPGIAAFLSAALRNVRDSVPIAGDGSDNLSPADALQAFHNLLAVHTELHRLYAATTPDEGFTNAFLNGIVLEVCRKLARVSVIVS
jgi:hypothetical protein